MKSKKILFLIYLFSTLVYAECNNINAKKYSITVDVLNKINNIELITLPLNFSVCGLYTKGRSLYGIDFSKTVDLTTDMLNEAMDIRFIKLPKGFNVNNLKTKDRDISGINFSETVGLSSEQLNLAKKSERVTLPKNFDVKLLNFKNRNMIFEDTDEMLGLSEEQVTDAKNVYLTHFSDNLDFSKISLKSKNLMWQDFSKSKGFSLEHINQAAFIANSTIPINLDLKNFMPKSENIIGIDFSSAINLDLSNFKDIYADGTKLPQVNEEDIINLNYWLMGYDISNSDLLSNSVISKLRSPPTRFPKGTNVSYLNTKGMSLANVDFTDTVGLEAKQINQAIDIRYMVFPSNFDLSKVSFKNKILMGNGLSNVKNLTCRHINESYGTIFYLGYPNSFPLNFDVSCLNFKKRFHYTDFSNTKGLSSKLISQAIELDSVTLPDGFDFSDFEPKNNLRLVRMNLSKTKKLTVNMLNRLSSFVNVVLPEMDVTGLITKNKNLYGVDFSKTTGLTIQMLEDAAYKQNLILPKNFDMTQLNTEKIMSIRSLDLTFIK